MQHTMQDQHVLILGLGASGLAMARWCDRMGAKVTVADTRAQPPQRSQLAAMVPAAQFVHTDFHAALVAGTSVRAVFLSPGLTPAQTQPVVDAALAAGLWLGGELSLFVNGLAALHQHKGYAPKVLAVTGTNGKTTVTALTGHLLRRSGALVAVAGNIGPSLLDTLLQAMDADALPDAWVLELSSFQLDRPCGFEPTAAVVLNLSQDHLDWHGSMQAYARAKSNVFGNGRMLLNRDDARVMDLLHSAPATGLQKALVRDYTSFGSDMPARPGDFGMEEANGMVWLVRALQAEEPRSRRHVETPALHIQRLMPADALRIRGRHNASNALAALALATSTGAPLGPMLFGLREYRGEPHRVQSLGMLNGVEFFDDSKGTNVGATVAALCGLGADRKVVVLLGGDGKGQDFTPLAEPVQRYVRAVVLIGRDAPLIRQALAPTGVPLLDAASMPDAVAQANRSAHSGDAVLLSPACASFDMFQDYAHRAQVFTDAVHHLAQEAGSEWVGVA